MLHLDWRSPRLGKTRPHVRAMVVGDGQAGVVDGCAVHCIASYCKMSAFDSDATWSPVLMRKHIR